MRERLVAALVGLTIVMIAIYAVPRAYWLADLISSQEQAKASRSVEVLAELLEERTETRPDTVTEAYLSGLLKSGETITYAQADGNSIRAGAPVVEERDIVATEVLRDGSTLTLSRSSDLVQERVRQALVPLLLLGLMLIVLSGVVGYVLARWLSRPFGELAAAAELIGEEQFDLDLPRYSVPEAEAVRRALRDTSHRLDTLLTKEREFAANASHQLRTPVTSLRLTLEDLTMWPETPDAVSAELTEAIGELDRLSNAVTELLALSRGRRLGDAVETDLNAQVGVAVERWSTHVRDSGREIVHSPTTPLVARVITGPVQQVLDILIENACTHGRGTITAGATGNGKFLHVSVSDEGTDRPDADAVFKRGSSAREGEGHGLGLAIADQLATSLGGYLKLSDARTTTFVLVLPCPGGPADPLG